MWDHFGGNGGSKTASRGLKAVDDLTTAVLATLSDHVAIVDGAGDIVAVNKAWKGYDCACGDHGLQRSEVGANYIDACEAAERAGAGGVEGVALGLRAVLDGSRPHFSLIYLCHSSSDRRWFRMTATPIGSPPDGAVISHASVGEPLPVGEAQATAAIAAAETGEPLLRALTENVAKTIGARFAFLSEVVDQRFERLQLIAFWSGEGFEEGFQYDVSGTPCQDVLSGELCVYPANVQEAFPDDVWLKEIAAQCYLGLPLYSSAGEVIGHLGVIHDQPLDNLSFAEHVLRAVAAQASPELERMRLVRALQRSERTARALLNAPMDSAILLERDGTITDLNDVAAVRLGTTVKEALGRSVFDLLPPELAATRRAALEKVMIAREPLRMEDERAGMHFESSIYPVLDSRGSVEALAIFASDVTARKVAEEELTLQARVLESMSEGVAAFDANAKILVTNPTFDEMFGYERGELINQHASVLNAEPPDENARILEHVQTQLERLGSWHGEFNNVRKDGTLFTTSAHVSALVVSGKTYLISVQEDITERKQVAAALRQSAERNASLLEAIPDMMFTVDRRGVYLDFVPAEGQEPYISEDDFLGRTVSEVMPPALAQDLLKAIELALDTGLQQQLAYELEIDDEKHHYEVRILRSKDDEALAIVRDVTAAKRQEREEKLRKARDELEGTVERSMLGKNPYGLTFREFTVLHLAADGEADKSIADQLGISTFTVSKHIANILGKMAASSRTEACVRALREGLLI